MHIAFLQHNILRMKKVMIAMLALAVVFGFAACDNQNGLTNRSVDYITINQLADFAEGQAFDASKYEVVAHNTDGTETTIDGLGLVKAVLEEGVWNGAVEASLTTANLAADQ